MRRAYSVRIERYNSHEFVPELLGEALDHTGSVLPPATQPAMADENYKQAFIAFSREHAVLRFGEYTLKSGRLSPYFFQYRFIRQRRQTRPAWRLLRNCHCPIGRRF